MVLCDLQHIVIETEDKQKISFKKLLLNRCQQEFQKDKTDKSEFEAMEKEIEEATSEDKKKTLKEELDLAIAKAKRRSLGNIRYTLSQFLNNGVFNRTNLTNQLKII